MVRPGLNRIARQTCTAVRKFKRSLGMSEKNQVFYELCNWQTDCVVSSLSKKKSPSLREGSVHF